MIAIYEAHRAGLLSRKHWIPNLLSGMVVGVVALPLAMAFAIASGVKPEQGLYTAIVAGALVSLFGGSRLQIAGPTGAFIVILAGITAKYGISGLQMATLMAGVILIAMGMTRMGAIIKYIPDPVIVGFTSGIAVIIFVGQWKSFFGLQPLGDTELFHQKLLQLLQAFPYLHLPTAALGMFTLLVLLVSPRLFKRIPAPLVAMVAATLIQGVFQFDGIATIGSAFGGIPQQLPSFEVPDFVLSDMLHLIGPAFTIALLGAIESLLSAVVADGMAGTKHDSNQELIGQGIANIFSPLFGGFAATGAIARTATNIRNGATSPLSGLVHALTLLLIILLLAPLAADIPLCALSAILFVVAWNMSEVHRFVHMVRTAPKPDIAILLITFLLTVFSDLVIAVNIGVLLAALLFMKRMSEAVTIERQERLPDEIDFPLPKSTVIFNIDGPFFFGAAERLETTLENVHSHADTLVLCLDRVPFIDATGLQSLWDLLDNCKRHRTRLILCGTRPNVMEKFRRAGLTEQIGRENFIHHLHELNAARKEPSV